MTPQHYTSIEKSFNILLNQTQGKTKYIQSTFLSKAKNSNKHFDTNNYSQKPQKLNFQQPPENIEHNHLSKAINYIHTNKLQNITLILIPLFSTHKHTYHSIHTPLTAHEHVNII